MRNSTSLRLNSKLLGLIVFVCALPAVLAQASSALELRQRSFEIVWRTVKEKHFDASFGGVDWDKVREKYAPRVASVKSDKEFYDLLQQMLGELHQSHFAIIPPDALVEEASGEASGGIGIDLRIIDRMAVITRVEPNSAAQRAGLRTGFIIKKIDGVDVEQIVERASKSKGSAGLLNLRITRAVLERTKGAPESSVRICYLDERDQRREVEIKRQRLDGEMSPPFGNFPPQRMEFEAKQISGGIGYIRFNVFVVPLMERIRNGIRSMRDAPGIIIDIRGNPGGFGGMAAGIVGLLEAKQVSLGTMRMRAGFQGLVAFPQKDPYTGPVVVLIDGLSGSTSEIFAGGLQEVGRAVVVGERSAGAALPSIITKLPTGALFQYAIADFRTPKGVLIEGRGVIPDVEVKLSRSALLEGRDPQLEAAIEQIQKLVRNRRAA
jgi:carboxyl-terminal processing protease